MPPPDRGPDARRLCNGGSLFPFIGTIVYLIVRPPEYLDDVRERELEIAAAEARLAASRPAVPVLRLRDREEPSSAARAA